MGALLFSSLACNTATKLIHRDKPAATSVPLQSALATSCPSTLNDIMTAATTPGKYKVANPETYLVTYDVAGDNISNPVFQTVSANFQSEQNDLATQKHVWEYFASLIPAQNRQMLSNYSILTDGKDNILAAVAQTRANPENWVLEVDIADANDYGNLTFTMIHEFGHILTLNADQVPPDVNVFNNPGNKDIYQQEALKCSSYFSGEGCSKSDSYMNQFYQRFWGDIYPEWSKIDQIDDMGLYYEKLNEFYKNHEDRFVSEYASTNPGEDIAETWAHFVLAPKPTGDTVANKKVLFFYEQPELVQLRAEILTRLCANYPD
jgi:hypothetical protein